jgi:hypothetical protein
MGKKLETAKNMNQIIATIPPIEVETNAIRSMTRNPTNRMPPTVRWRVLILASSVAM